MQHPKVSPEEMLARVVRFSDYTKEKAVPLMFIDSFLPGHHRLNYAVVGDTASENPDYEVILSQPHKFQIGMFKAMPNGMAPLTIRMITWKPFCRLKASGASILVMMARGSRRVRLF